MDNSKEREDSSTVHSRSRSRSEKISIEQDVERQALDDTNTQEKTPTDPNIVDWDGPDDPANPMNWSSARKVGAIGIVSMITMLS